MSTAIYKTIELILIEVVMHILGLLIYFIPAIYFAVHSIKSNQNSYWLFILFVFPILGSVVYALVIWMPAMRYSRHGYKLERAIKKQLAPNKSINQALKEYELNPTTNSCVTLADAYTDKGDYQNAIKYYQESLQGINQYSPDIMLKYADVLYEAGEYARCKETLDLLCEKNPTFSSNTGHFLYARSLARLGLVSEADNEFRALLNHRDHIEYKVAYAEFLFEQKRVIEAMPLIDEVIKTYSLLPKAAQNYNKHWYQMAVKLKNSKLIE
ncbi:TPA: tetratricopeptide repeat protein [Providencia alcalifaciens]|nr:tetratricopeptide repeat protein [Providencia alcalifaciens]